MSVPCAQEVQDFLDTWQQDPLQAKKAFTDFQRFLAGRSGVSLDFKARPGVSYSLRARQNRSRSANFLCSWTWWMTSRKTAGCQCAFTPT